MIELAERELVNDRWPTAWYEPNCFGPRCQVEHCNRTGEYRVAVFPQLPPWVENVVTDIIQRHDVLVCHKHKNALMAGVEHLSYSARSL